MTKHYTKHLLPLLLLLIAYPFSRTNAQNCVGQPLFPAGTYTINNTQPTAGTNFHSFGDAVNAISCGIAGPVVFNCAPGTGPYNEQVIIPAIANTSQTNYVLFNGNNDTVSFNATVSTQPATIKLLGAHNIILNNLVVVAGSQNLAYGIHLMSDADSNKIINCTVISDRVGVSSSGSAGILINGITNNTYSASTSNCDYNIISNNTVIGGYVGICYASNTAGKTKGTRITNNVIQDFASYGIYTNYADSVLIESNSISRPMRTNSTAATYGIYLSNASTRIKISKNRIFNLYGNIDSSNGTQFISLNNPGATLGNENEISNNLIYSTKGKSSFWGIYCAQVTYTKIFQNTIALDDTAALYYSGSLAGVRGFMYAPSGTPTNVFFENNIISIGYGGTSTKYCVYAQGTTGLTLNNNVYFMHATSGSTVATGYWTANRTTLSDWQNASGQDNYSVAVDPMYQNPANGIFKPTNLAINNIGAVLGVGTDIVGAARDPQTPDPGAYEFGNLCDTSFHIYPGTATTTSVTFSWDHVAVSTGYEYLIDQNANGPLTGGGIATTDTFATVSSGLITGGSYYFHVRTNCGAGNFSDWKTFAFTMPCDNISVGTTTATGGINFCPGDSLKVSTIITGATGSLTFQWSLWGNNSIPGATDSVYYAHNSGFYFVKVSSSPYCYVNGGIMLVAFYPINAAITPASINICDGQSAVLEANNTTGITYQWKKDGQDIVGATSFSHTDSVAGNYVVIETDAHNCRDSSNIVPFTVMPTPTATITASSLNFCTNDSTLLTAPIANSYSYTWLNNGNTFASGLQNTQIVYIGGEYRVAVTQGLCTDTSDVIAVTTKPLPVPIISQTGTTLATGLFNSYQWYKDGTVITGATDQLYEVTEDGAYTVMVSDTSGCSGSAAAAITMTNVGVNEVNAHNGITVYPNPVSDILMINAPNAVNAQVTGLDGKVVLQQQNAHQLDMSTLANGTYILRISDNSGQLLYSTSVVKKSH
ncbi:T9SS type A sorting domain-containing protein [Taibaiella soli]|uniref:Secretion system C-terminal sorting domain-containing protein n=1 Tax=Taibaiella soli TaxID=1649169 RepID=A0A2W2BTJ8_9BACT|nr:T9SS type A sorting domain-containing protein [Taibaiella soli]PZF71113.1 hypothetical protein DN068_20670 [Taibaiella soli]